LAECFRQRAFARVQRRRLTWRERKKKLGDQRATGSSNRAAAMTSPEVVDVVGDDTEDLVERAGDGDQAGCCRQRRRRRRRGGRGAGGWFLAEPVLTAYCFCEFPTMILSQMYALDWITINRCAAAMYH